MPQCIFFIDIEYSNKVHKLSRATLISVFPVWFTFCFSVIPACFSPARFLISVLLDLLVLFEDFYVLILLAIDRSQKLVLEEWNKRTMEVVDLGGITQV